MISCEWGFSGLEYLSEKADLVIIVDVMSFSTCVDIAVTNGAEVFPYRYKDQSATAYAETHGAVLAKKRNEQGFTLSPVSLLTIPEKTKLVLPSPNGATLSYASKAKWTITGCLRNAAAVAKFSASLSENIAVIPAGEQWPDGSLRVAYEDLIGAGAIISLLSGPKSPEARMAEVLFESAQKKHFSALREVMSAKELIHHGFEQDVVLACQFNISQTIPVLVDYKYISQM